MKKGFRSDVEFGAHGIDEVVEAVLYRCENRAAAVGRREYFDACFARIPDFDREKAVIVGDSLTSDILGGKNAGITTVWVNPEHLPWGNIQPDYEIEALRQLEPLLEVL